jgi:menaquinone-dependent protoporphyrinogen IX oxidase
VRIGIIVFSRTGNTLSVAEKIREACAGGGHDVSVEQIRIEGGRPTVNQPPKLTETPDLSRYEAVYLGSPVEGFSVSAVMKAYLSQIPRLDKMKAGVFVTEQFPKPWLGGNQAIRQMRALCREKGLDVWADGIVNWSSKARGAQIAAIAAKFGKP